jgi:serine/threonine-protein kinase
VRSDIYSLGCAFFYMLSGRPPFPEGTVLQKLLQHQGDKPPDIQQFRPELPEEVSHVMRKMLAKDPGDRYQTSLELVEHLQLLAEHMGMRPQTPGLRVWMAPRGRPFSALQRHLPWMAPVAALLGIVALLHFLWTSPPTSPPGLSPRVVAPVAQASPEELVSSLPDVEPSKRDEPTGGATAAPPTTLPATMPPAASTTAPAEQSVASTAGGASPPSSPGAPALADQVPFAGLGPERNAAGLAASQETAATLAGQDGREGFALGAWPLSELLPVKSAPETRPAVDAPPKLSGVLTVGDAGVGGRNFATLAAASRAAESGDIIELRYNGRREEKPILLPNAKLVIRAGQGFQPVVVFRPNDPDPVKYPRTLFSLTGSELALVNVAVELDIPRDVPADRWTLLELGRAESLRLEKCSLTIRNAYHQEVAFFRVKAPAGADVLPEEAASPSQQAARITLTDCIVRGEAVVVRAEALQPVHFAWTNGLLLTTEQLLWAAGGDTMPGPGQDIQVQLKHLTATVEAGLCRLDSRRFAKYQLPTQVDCSDSILMASVDSPLVEQIGEKSPEGSRPLFAWNGDRNLYQGFIVFWKVDDLDPSTPSEPMEFEAWQSRWFPDHEIHSRWGRVDFRQLPEATAPLDARTPLDYMLSDSVENWARSAASDGTDVGFSADRLPPLPPPLGKP